MNYLAHAFLSFGESKILAGNMISDFVKGKQKLLYEKGVQNGIMLHRMIDTFTDTHKATYEAKRFFKPAVGLYAGAFADIAYDHFLALDKSQHTPEQLKDFAEKTYNLLKGFIEVMPEKFLRMFPYMQSQNWLYNYRTVDGIRNSFGGLVRRAVYLDNSEAAFEAFLKNYDELKACYETFFPQVKQYAFVQLQLLTNDS